MPNKDTKSRILQVHKILVEETDTEHYITVQQIIDKLAEVGISAYRQTILSDIEQLIDAGVDIRCVKSSQNRYYIENGLFSFAELRLLVDAVEASQFITRHKSSILIDKLCSLTALQASIIMTSSVRRYSCYIGIKMIMRRYLRS